MNKLFTLAAALLLTVCAAAAELSAPVERATTKAQQQISTTALAQASRCLRGRENCTVVDWPTAARHHNQAVTPVKQRQANVEKYKQLTAKLPAVSNSSLSYTPENEKKVLAKLKNHSFIFIGETHIAGVRPGIQRILKTIREQNPNKRILLATEMLVTYAPTDALPLQKNKTSNPDIRPANEKDEWITPLAKELNFDVLALDDRWLEQKYNALGGLVYPIKIGNFLVEVDSSYQEAIEVANSRYGRNISNNPVLMIYALHDFFGASWWGVTQRNLQWTAYLKAVKKDYDLIIVYGGSGHLDTLEGVASVPQQLGLTSYAFVRVSKVPSAQERQDVEQLVRNRSRGTRTADNLPTKAVITQEPAPSVMARYNAQVRERHTGIVSQVISLEKTLGFYNDKSLRIRIVYPQ